MSGNLRNNCGDRQYKACNFEAPVCRPPTKPRDLLQTFCQWLSVRRRSRNRTSLLPDLLAYLSNR